MPADSADDARRPGCTSRITQLISLAGCRPQPRTESSHLLELARVVKLIMIIDDSKTWRRVLSPVPPDPSSPTIKTKIFDQSRGDRLIDPGLDRSLLLRGLLRDVVIIDEDAPTA
jgi:hypothetical protein